MEEGNATQSVIEQMAMHAVISRNVPFVRAGEAVSGLDIDVTAALCRPAILKEVSGAIVALAAREGVEFTCVGGLTVGANAVAVGVSLASGAPWFTVRRVPENRGDGHLIEGARLGRDSRVLLVEDVTGTGRSMLKAMHAVSGTGARVVAAVPVIDRGGDAPQSFAERGVRYLPLMQSSDIGIPLLGARATDDKEENAASSASTGQNAEVRETVDGMTVTRHLSDAELQENLPVSLDELRDVLRHNRIARAWLFGSRSRGEHRPDSDIDLLYEADGEKLQLLEYGALLSALSDFCPVEVDLADAIIDRMKPYIEDDLVRVL